MMLEAPKAPARKFTAAGSVYPTHAELAAWMRASWTFHLAEAREHVAMAETCTGTSCTVDEHLDDAREAMRKAERFAPKGARA